MSGAERPKRRRRMAQREPDHDNTVQLLAALNEVTVALNPANRKLSLLAEQIARAPRVAPGDQAMAAPASFEAAPVTSLRPAIEIPAPVSDEAVLRGLAREHGLDAAMERLIQYRNDDLAQSRPRYWAIIDFHLHSAKRRLFVFDVAAQSVGAYLCAHGRGSEGASDDGFADVFSNQDGSNASSLGIYRCAETFEGDHGYAMRLDGLEASNSNARHRAIVVHGADYVSQDVINQTGRIGRSKGCPAVENQHVPTVVDALKFGSLLLAWKS
jgi:hypothetical protein